MPEPVSRVLVAVEALIILLPTTLLALYGMVFLLGAGVGNGVAQIDLAPLVLMVASLSGLAVGWLLTIRFIRGGNRALRASTRAQWSVAGIGAALALLAFIVVLLDQSFPVPATLAEASGLGLLSFGAPALIPFTHIAIEAKVRGNAR
jgi:hypothetical protein